jgi:hypothetical protein
MNDGCLHRLFAIFNRYCLQQDMVLSRIPIQYPVYKFIPDLVHGVHHRILTGEANIHTFKRTKHRQLI